MPVATDTMEDENGGSLGGSEDAGGAGTCPTYDGADSKAPAPRRQILHCVQNDMRVIFRGMTAKGAAGSE